MNIQCAIMNIQCAIMNIQCASMNIQCASMNIQCENVCDCYKSVVARALKMEKSCNFV